MWSKEDILHSDQTTNPLISIITVVYNAQEYLQTTIDSVTKLGGSNIRYIVIDGGSTDSTIDIIKKNERHIHFWCTEKDNGIYDAFNKGWNVADLESYILYLGAGDRVVSLPHEDTFQKADVICGSVIINENHVVRAKIDFRLKL